MSPRRQKVRTIVWLGPGPQAPGGISAVLTTLLDPAVQGPWPIVMVPTWREGSIATRLAVALGATLRLWGLAMRGRVQAVHAHTAGRGSWWRKSLMVAPLQVFGVKTILHLHDGSFIDWLKARSALTRAWVRWVLEQADAAVVLSPHWQQALQPVAPRAQWWVLPNPVPEARWCHHVPAAARSDRPPSGAVGPVLFLSRLWTHKGVDDLLDAAARLHPNWPALQWVLAGDGDEARLRQQVQALGLQGCVHFKGWVQGEAKQALLQTADLLVLPSWAEGQPVVVLEAMAVGLPVVATSVGGIPELLQHGGGVLVPPRDPARLAQAIAGLLNAPQRRRDLGRQGRAQVWRHHTPQAVQQRLDALYRHLGLKPDRPEPCAP